MIEKVGVHPLSLTHHLLGGVPDDGRPLRNVFRDYRPHPHHRASANTKRPFLRPVAENRISPNIRIVPRVRDHCSGRREQRSQNHQYSSHARHTSIYSPGKSDRLLRLK